MNVRIAPRVEGSENHYDDYSRTRSSRTRVVIGIQMAHAGMPPELSYSWGEGEGYTVGSCRPITLTVRPK